jgi:hypothetical protein
LESPRMDRRLFGIFLFLLLLKEEEKLNRINRSQGLVLYFHQMFI